MTARTALLFLLTVTVIIVLVWVARAQSDAVPPPEDSTVAPASAAHATAPTYNAVTAPGVAVLRVKLRAEHRRYLAAVQRVRHLHRVLMHRASTREAITLACAVYGSCSTLWRRADCESHLNPNAQNRWSDASGLFQFLGSTWRSTPFGSLSVFSPYANALAAGWMEANGRGGEWVCR